LEEDEIDLTLPQKCNSCKETKTLADFYADKNRLSGRSPECKCCKKTREKAAYQRDKEKFKARSKQWRKDNYPRYIATQKKWREANPDKVNAATKRSIEKRKLKRIK